MIGEARLGLRSPGESVVVFLGSELFESILWHAMPFGPMLTDKMVYHLGCCCAAKALPDLGAALAGIAASCVCIYIDI